MPNTLGTETKSVFYKGVDGEDIHVEFVAGGTIKKGQPVKLDATGAVVAASADEPNYNIIGTSIHDRVVDELVTIATKFRCIINATSKAALDAGPVKYAGFKADPGVNQYAILAGGDDKSLISGYSLNAATGADEDILVGQL